LTWTTKETATKHHRNACSNRSKQAKDFKKHLEMVNRTSIKVKDFTQTSMDYISVDLDYKILKETTKHHRNACSNRGKHAKDFKTLGDGQQDLNRGKRLHPNTNGLHIC